MLKVSQDLNYSSQKPTFIAGGSRVKSTYKLVLIGGRVQFLGTEVPVLEDHQLQVVLGPWRPSLSLFCGPSISKASIWSPSHPAHFTQSPGRTQSLVRTCLIGSDTIVENK